MDHVEEEALKGGDDDRKKKVTVGRNNKEYREFRRQSVKHTAAAPKARQASVFGSRAEIPPTDRPSRPTPKSSGIVIPPPKKRAKEAVGKYLLGEALGRGQFGLVFKGIDSETGSFVAIKQLKSNQLSEDSLKAFEAEIVLLSQLDHDGVVRYLDCVRTTDHVNLVIEYCDGGALSSIVKKFGKVPEKLCALYIYQCLQGLEYLHSQGVVHRDIKCANILFTTKSGKVKLADFGISTTANNPDGPDAGVGFGSPYWMAPEVIEMEIIPNEKADIWSLGCTLIEIFTGNPPYHQYHPMGAIVKCVQDDHPPLPAGISTLMEEFLLKCFQKNRDQRPSASDLLLDPWFNQIKEPNSPVEKIMDMKPEKMMDLKPEKQMEKYNDFMDLSNTKQIQVFGESIRADTPSKNVFITGSTTAEEVVQLVLIKYNSTEDPYNFAMFVDNTLTGESKQLDEYEYLMPVANSPESKDFRFSIVPRTDLLRRKEGLLFKRKAKRLPFFKNFMMIRAIIDLEERYAVFFRGDRPSSELEEPLSVVYNLRMIRDVQMTLNDEKHLKFEFSFTYCNEPHTFRTTSSAELEDWIRYFKKAVAISHPLHLGTAGTNLRGKKNRESKVIDVNEIINHRPRLSSGRSILSTSSAAYSINDLPSSFSPSYPSPPSSAPSSYPSSPVEERPPKIV